MGHPNVPRMYTYTHPHRDIHRSSQLQPSTQNDNLNNALGAIRVLGLELIEDELKPHLNTVLINIKERNKGAAEQVVISGILPILALSLRHRGPLTRLTAKLVAELAKESVVRKGFGDAGLVTALLSVLTSPDQELLLHAARAISRISYDNSKLQELLLRRGAVPRLVAILLRFPDEEALEEVCLLALCNLSGMGVAEEAGMVWERGAPMRPGESVFHGISPHTCGFASSVIMVCASQWAPGRKDDGPLIPCLPDNLSPRQLTLFSLLDLSDKSTATLIIKDSGLASTNRCRCQVQVTFQSDSLGCVLLHYYGGLGLGEELRENGINSLKSSVQVICNWLIKNEMHLAKENMELLCQEGESFLIRDRWTWHHSACAGIHKSDSMMMFSRPPAFSGQRSVSDDSFRSKRLGLEVDVT